MLVTPQVVMLHWPKTGGTFVTAALIAIHQARGDRLVECEAHAAMPRPGAGDVWRVRCGARSIHGRRRDLPAAWRTLPILGTIRHPLSRYVSQYAFSGMQMPFETYVRTCNRPPGGQVRSCLEMFGTTRTRRLEDIRGVTWLRMERLADDLADALPRFGYTAAEAAWVRQMAPVYPDGARRDDPWPSFYDADLRAYVRRVDEALVTFCETRVA